MPYADRSLSLLLAVLLVAAPMSGAERVTLGPDNWDDYAPAGKEVDCIYGDVLLRNDRIVAVVAKPVAGRNANMMVRNVGGAVIDLTRRDKQNDQLSAFYPGGKEMTWRVVNAQETTANQRVEDKTVRFVCRAQAAPGKPEVELRYTLADGDDCLLVETVYSNQGDQPLELSVIDDVRADGSFDKVPDGDTSIEPGRPHPGPLPKGERVVSLFWAYDKWFGQAYGLLATDMTLNSKSDVKNSTIRYAADDAKINLKPGESASFKRRLFPAATLLELRAIANKLAGTEQHARELVVKDTAGQPLAAADVEVRQGKRVYANGRTGTDGRLRFEVPPGEFVAHVSAAANGSQMVELNGSSTNVELPEAGYVVAQITAEGGGPIPCKVQFLGREGTRDPDFGHQTGEWGVRSAYYSENGQFRQALAPGKYQAIVSYGPEHDAAFVDLEVRRGEAAKLEAVLVRSVQTPGWVSADFHSHSSPSGDNTSSQLGRVLNLLCEHIEFAPCTEHNRLSTYDPHLARLKAGHLMATCTGIELTDSPGDLNHHNAFPLIPHVHTQDNGAPLSDADMELKIERLALWDDRSDKLVQQNHPDIGHVFFDKNGDGQPDGGFKKALGFMDVIEVHPPHTIFDPPTSSGPKARNNTIFNWLQLLNQGYRIPGVINTDAHYNFHGSGFRRVYLESDTDDPSKIKTLDMVHAAEHGHVLMTTGPFLEVLVSANESGDRRQGTMGDDLAIPGGKAKLKIRVQCPNWFDIDRVQVYLNGRPEPSLNFTRSTTPERFAGGTVKFDQELPLTLAGDTHVIVAAAAEKSTLGPVMGPAHAKDMPIAVTNPIYIDVDGGKFRSSGDTLGAPLPVMSGKARQ